MQAKVMFHWPSKGFRTNLPLQYYIYPVVGGGAILHVQLVYGLQLFVYCGPDNESYQEVWIFDQVYRFSYKAFLDIEFYILAGNVEYYEFRVEVMSANFMRDLGKLVVTCDGRVTMNGQPVGTERIMRKYTKALMFAK